MKTPVLISTIVNSLIGLFFYFSYWSGHQYMGLINETLIGVIAFLITGILVGYIYTLPKIYSLKKLSIILIETPLILIMGLEYDIFSFTDSSYGGASSDTNMTIAIMSFLASLIIPYYLLSTAYNNRAEQKSWISQLIISIIFVPLSAYVTMIGFGYSGFIPAIIIGIYFLLSLIVFTIKMIKLN